MSRAYCAPDIGASACLLGGALIATIAFDSALGAILGIAGTLVVATSITARRHRNAPTREAGRARLRPLVFVYQLDCVFMAYLALAPVLSLPMRMVSGTFTVGFFFMILALRREAGVSASSDGPKLVRTRSSREPISVAQARRWHKQRRAGAAGATGDN